MQNTSKLSLITTGLVALASVLVDGAMAQETNSPIIPASRIDLFNGTNLSGWSWFAKNKEEAAQTWSVTNGVIHCTGAPVGYLRTEKDYRDYKLTVEWRFVQVAPKADNGGVLVHMKLPDELWPPCVQCQGRHRNQGDLFMMGGAESKEHLGKGVNAPIPLRGPPNEKPVGEWDTIEVLCSSNSVKAWVNGKLMNEATECTISSGKIGFQSEGGEMEIRKVFIEPVKP